MTQKNWYKAVVRNNLADREKILSNILMQTEGAAKIHPHRKYKPVLKFAASFAVIALAAVICIFGIPGIMGKSPKAGTSCSDNATVTKGHSFTLVAYAAEATQSDKNETALQKTRTVLQLDHIIRISHSRICLLPNTALGEAVELNNSAYFQYETGQNDVKLESVTYKTDTGDMSRRYTSNDLKKNSSLGEHISYFKSFTPSNPDDLVAYYPTGAVHDLFAHPEKANDYSRLENDTLTIDAKFADGTSLKLQLLLSFDKDGYLMGQLKK